MPSYDRSVWEVDDIMKGNEIRVQERVLDLSKGKKKLRRLVERSVGLHLKISCIHMVIEGHKVVKYTFMSLGLYLWILCQKSSPFVNNIQTCFTTRGNPRCPQTPSITLKNVQVVSSSKIHMSYRLSPLTGA